MRISITTGSAATSITATRHGDTVTVDCDGACQQYGADACGSSAEVVTGLIGNITAGSLTGALTVTTGDATDNTHIDHDRLGSDLDHRDFVPIR